ncbi:MAG: hypothetical protein HKO64_12230 [Xanthomonadales bacterium]|nr:hypothetical protein [Xanthomonadales bacterium]
MKKRIFVGLAILAMIGIGIIFHDQIFDRGRLTTSPTYDNLQRAVRGNDIESRFDPAATVSFSEEFEYIGGQKFILYGVADTEQYFFVEKTAGGKLKSVYWVQYEAYLEDNDYTYDYSGSPGRTRIGGFEFFVDQEFFVADPDAKRRKGTDGAMYRQFLTEKGFELPANAYYARLVHMTDDSNRKELMIIFIEQLPESGLNAADYLEGGSRIEQAEHVKQQFFDKVRRTISMRANLQNSESGAKSTH